MSTTDRVASLDDAAVTVRAAHQARGVTYWQPSRDLIDATRLDVLDVCGPPSRRPTRHRMHVAGAVETLGAAVADRLGFGVPTEVLISRNDPIGYHLDITGPPNTSTAMVFLRHDMDGGETVLPERGLAFAAADAWALAFDGRRILHGVAPLIPRAPDAYRTSLVFYLPAG